MNTLVSPELTAGWQIAAQRRRIALLVVLTILATLVWAGFVLLLQGVSAILLVVWIAVAAVIWQPRFGLYLAFALVLLFEAGGADPLMSPGVYLNLGFQSTLGIAGLIASPLELLLLLTFGSWLSQGIARRRLNFRGGALFWPVLLFYLAVIFGIARGVIGGGSANMAFWEARALLYVLICYIVAANTIRTRRHVSELTGIALVAIGLYAVEGAYRRLYLYDTGHLGGVSLESAYAHHVVIFLGALSLLVLAQHVVGAPRWQRALGLVVGPVALFTLMASERRAGQIALLVAFLGFSVVFLVAQRKAFFLVVVPLLVGGAIYLPLFWNNTSLIGQPARAVRSLTQPDARDAASNGYRDLEKINVRATIQSDPVRGVGFGREFLFVAPMPNLDFWEFWRYEPHHNILWVWLKTGIVGFALFWMLMGTCLGRAAHLARKLRAPELRVFSLFSLGSIILTLIFCWVDLGLATGMVTVFLGTVMGVLAILDNLEKDDGLGSSHEGAAAQAWSGVQG